MPVSTQAAAGHPASFEASAAAAAAREPRMVLWRLASLALFALAWEIAGRIPINPAFPSFTDTVRAFVRMIADGSLPLAYLLTLQPLLIGVAISACFGVAIGIAMGLRPLLEWLGA